MLTKLGDLRDILLLLMAGALIALLAMTGSVDHDTTQKAMIFFLGVVGGAVTMAQKPAAGA